MKIDFIELEKNIIEFGLDQLSDSLKALLYEYDQSIFDDFYFDSNYLEPQLFYLFSKKNIDPPLQYILNKYMNKEKSVIFDLIENPYKIHYIPGYGTTQNINDKKLVFKDGSFYNLHGKNIEIEADIKISESDICLCSSVPNVLVNYTKGISYQGIYKTILNSIPNIETAWKNITTYSPDFGDCINKSTKEISISNFPEMPSFASRAYFGTSFINIHNQNPTDVFFMDEIAHQSGHTIFYLCTLNPNDYFKYPFNTPLKNINGSVYETREIYGCFHSMFTLCTIIHTLNNYFSSGEFEKNTEIELIGRIGFYLNKLIFDVNNLANCDIFTNEGLLYYEMFRKNSIFYSDLYEGLFKKLSFENQNYYFNLDVFMNENKKFINEKNIII